MNIDLLPHALDRFRRCFKKAASFAASAPGRVNLIGEHTDYNEGFVLPMAIERRTVIVAGPAPGRRAAVVSGNQPEAAFDVNKDLVPGEPAWSNYVRGVVAGCLRNGLDPGGFDAVIESEVPLGGGLSSSAALEVATATLIEALTGKRLDAAQKALLCQKAEHDFAGVPCGIMDQFISTMGQRGHAMLLDCRTQQPRMVAMRDDAVTVLIANTNVKHELTGGEYGQRRAQCEQAARALGLKVLRDATTAQLDAARGGLDPLAYRRARHVITENDRTVAAADLLAAGDWNAVGKLMSASHQSLRDDFEVSCSELDVMVELARGIGVAGGVYGSRMTGGGFGGCTVSLVRTDQADAIAHRLNEGYRKQTGIEPTIFATRPADGARIESV